MKLMLTMDWICLLFQSKIMIVIKWNERMIRLSLVTILSQVTHETIASIRELRGFFFKEVWWYWI